MCFALQELGGEEAIMKYNHELAKAGGQYLADLWNTEVIAPPEMMDMSITTVVLPTSKSSSVDECTAVGGVLKSMGMVVGKVISLSSVWLLRCDRMYLSWRSHC